LTEYNVAHEEAGRHGRYVIRLDDGSEAEMDYVRRDQTTIDVHHTGVPPAFRNRGLAQILMDAAIADAQARGHRIVPTCSYVAAQFRRHPEWASLMAG
jgi:uncharacterized protein